MAKFVTTTFSSQPKNVVLDFTKLKETKYKCRCTFRNIPGTDDQERRTK